MFNHIDNEKYFDQLLKAASDLSKEIKKQNKKRRDQKVKRIHHILGIKQP